MYFLNDLNNNINKICNIYDFVAYSYCFLVNNIKNDIDFIGTYICENTDIDKSNPNLILLKKMSIEIRQSLINNPLQCFSSESRFCDILNIISNVEKNLKEFEDELTNHATIAYHTLLGFDLFFADSSNINKNFQPLNDYGKNQCLIYIGTSTCLIDRIEEINDFPNTIRSNEIKNSFRNIIIINTNDISKDFGTPRLVTLTKAKNQFVENINYKKMKIAVIPIYHKKWFDFYHVKGASFEVKYDISQQKYIENKVIKLLDKAIDHGSNIIVFPEYMCNQYIQKKISEHLYDLNIASPNKLDNLLLVVAGSAWTDESNNVSKIYSYNGNLLGEEYKFSAFDKSINGSRYVEHLLNPGKKITLVKILGVGIIQIGICRDISVDDYSLKLADCFGSQFLFIPAWSASINIGFTEQMKHIISRNHKTCSVMCNCCGAIYDENEFKKILGAYAYPEKKKSTVIGNIKYIERNNELCNQCDLSDCIFEIIYDFEGDQIETTVKHF